MSMEFTGELSLHLRSGYPLIFVITQEENRALRLLGEVAAETGQTIIQPRTEGQQLPISELTPLVDQETDTVVVLDDVHRRLDDPEVLRVLTDLAAKKRNRFSTVILAPWVDLPPELERQSAILELPLPSPQQLKEAMTTICDELQVAQSAANGIKLTRAAQGLTLQEAKRAFRKSMIGWPEDADGAFTCVTAEKKRALRRSRVLEDVAQPASLDDVGGLDQLKSWLNSRVSAFTVEARRYGLPAPRGLLLMGIQGCGKSLSAKAVAGYWNLPLARLDIAAVFGSNRPEEALQGALRTAEAMAPVVLWIDEIEKGFESQGQGAASRLLGGMVTWLQEKTAEVFVVATANRVAALPPELPRKGRFDEIFFVDLPNFHERFEILKLHMKKRGRDPDIFSIEALAQKADHLTGSELEQIIVSAMYSAFSRNLELSDNDLLRALKETVPLYETFEDQIKELREWARKRARPASTDRRKIDLFSDSV